MNKSRHFHPAEDPLAELVGLVGDPDGPTDLAERHDDGIRARASVKQPGLYEHRSAPVGLEHDVTNIGEVLDAIGEA